MKYKLNKKLITQRIDNKTVIFLSEQSMLYTLNETADYIFQGLSLGWGNKKIIKGLAEEFGATLDEAERDLEEMVNTFYKEGVLLK